MFWDISIALGLLSASVFMAYLGVHVTLHQPDTTIKIRNRKIAFLSLGILAGALTLFQGIRNGLSQHELMEAIKNNKPVVNVLPASPTIEVTPFATLPTPKSGISLVQNSLNPQAIQYPWQKTVNLDKPGVTAILTASGELKHPLFTFICSVPCVFAQGNGISTAFLAHLVKEKSTNVRLVMQLDVPGKLSDGQQIAMDFRSQSDREVKIESLELTHP